MRDSKVVANWTDGRWKMNDQKFRAEVHKTQKMLDKGGLRPMRDHLVLFQHIYRDWNGKADYLTHKAREEGPCWNSFAWKLKRGWRIFGPSSTEVSVTKMTEM